MHQQHPQPGLLIAEEHERHERHVLIRHRDEAGLGQPRIGVAPLSDGELVVLATPGAYRAPSLVAALPGLLRAHTTGIDLVWLGVGGLAADTEVAQRLAAELGVEIAAPDGGVATMPGAALYAGHGAGGTGWHRFRPDQLVSFHGARIPLPEWESWLPAGPAALDDVAAVPVPCGLLVRGREDETGTAVFEIPVNPRFPKIVVAAPSAAGTAALLEGLPPRPMMVVPATPEAGTHTWQTELAMRLSREIVFSAGPQHGGTTVAPGGGFRPFPIVLRQAARGGDQQVLAVAPPPPGWVRAGQRSYRFADGGDHPVFADVVPSGLALRTADGEPDPGAAAAPYDPAKWTLTLGAAGAPIGLPVLAAAEQLLEALPPEERAAVTVRMAGVPDREAEHALDHRARSRKPSSPPRTPLPKESEMDGGATAQLGVRSIPDGSVTAQLESVTVEPAQPLAGFEPARAEPMVPALSLEKASAEPARPTPSEVDGMRPEPAPVPVAPALAAAPPPVMTTSGAPVSTVSTDAAVPVPPKASPPPEEPRPEPPVEPVRDEPAVEPEADPEPPSVPAAPTPPAGPTVQQDAPRPEEPDEPAPPAIQPKVVPVRASTTAEQNRFLTAAGEDFGIALATVNAALATWPSMRVDESPASKADYVAVCLYLNRGAGAAGAVNGVLRTGEGPVLDGQIPCLMSGLRRLPTHRRAVLRQGRVTESLEHRGDLGTVLTEPGFLAGSMDLDVTVPGADLDVLIWPASARRTSELMLSRPIGEAVFTAGARFKTLAVRSVEDDELDAEEADPDALSAPKIAVLFRELAPGETVESTDLDDRDRAVLAKLDTVLAGRRNGALRLVEDPDMIARLTTSMVRWGNETASEGKSVAVAS